MAKVLFVVLLFASAFSQDINETSKHNYCIVDANGPGIFIGGGTKDSPYVDEVSKFIDNSTTALSFSGWEISNSNKSSPANQLILDQRWENVLNNHNHRKDIGEQLKLDLKIFLSIKVDTNTDYFKKGWNHLMKNGKNLYSCDISKKQCQKEIDLSATNLYEFYTKNAMAVWKLHNYRYLYTEEESNTIIYQTSKSSEECMNIEKGCVLLYLSLCENCSITLQINTTYTTNTTVRNMTKKLTGNGAWTAMEISLENFVNCFNISASTQKPDSSAGQVFWAIGDIGYFSTNLSCAENKRYLEAEKDKNLTCENALNETFPFAGELPRPVRKKNKNLQVPPDKSSSFNLLYLLIIIPVALIASFVTFCVYKRRQNTESNEYQANFINNNLDRVHLLSSSKNITQPVKRSDFANYVEEVLHLSNTHHYLQQQFSKLPSGYSKPFNEGEKQENVVKNRFVKIYPYDENRVKLEKNLEDENNSSDYINASYVQSFNHEKEYIVTQNPLHNTTMDFFHMIWQEKIEYIVMISSINEEYHKYWPDFGKTFFYDGIEVSLQQVSSYEYYDHRIFQIRRYGEVREINQLHFQAWSQKLLSSHCFLDFINHLLTIPHNGVPVVFHCLAGIGRSATVLLCDIALRTSAITGSFDLFNITKQLRECRADMVANVKQYELAHLIILESLEYKDKGVEINSDYASSFSRLFEDNTIKMTWSRYLENREWLYHAVDPPIPCDNYPKRNRYTDKNLLPVEHSRVKLQYKQPDYIHAMYVKNYKQFQHLIVAQQPLHNTVFNFWLMALQQHVSVVINLNELDHKNPGDCCFFPTSLKKKISLGEIKITCSDEERNLINDYDKFNLSIKSMSKNLHNITLININGWPKIKSIPESTDIMLSIWKATNGGKINNFPILICCDDGVKSSSLVACFFYMADKMLYQHKCDIVGAVRAVRRTNTNFINFDQYVFLHHCALAFYKDCYKQYAKSDR